MHSATVVVCEFNLKHLGERKNAEKVVSNKSLPAKMLKRAIGDAQLGRLYSIGGDISSSKSLMSDFILRWIPLS